jgi:hypothetical protein
MIGSGSMAVGRAAPGVTELCAPGWADISRKEPGKGPGLRQQLREESRRRILTLKKKHE